MGSAAIIQPLSFPFPPDIVQSLPQSWDIELSWDTIYFAPYNESIGEHFEKNVLPIVITKNLSSFQTYDNWYGNVVVFEEKIPQLATILLQPLKSTSFTANLSHFPFSTRKGDCTQRDRWTHRQTETERERPVPCCKPEHAPSSHPVHQLHCAPSFWSAARHSAWHSWGR